LYDGEAWALGKVDPGKFDNVVSIIRLAHEENKYTVAFSKGVILVGVLDACHSAGLMVVAIVCDTGANSVKAKKQLDVSRKAPVKHWKNAVDKAKRNFLDKEYKNCAKVRHMH
jgi:hypothetical protein